MYPLLFMGGFVGVGILNLCIVYASRALKCNLAYMTGTLFGAMCGIALGGVLSK